MGLHDVDLPLIVETDSDGNPRIKNAAPTKNPPELPLFKLNDFITNSPANVTIVEITNCDINELPSSIERLNLKQLILNHNKLKEIPSCLYSGLATLELLDLSYNLLTEFQIVPACNGSIVVLKLSCNKIENFPYWILSTHCPELREVYYSHNFVVKLDACRALNIRKLELCNNHLMDVDFTFLKKIKTLEFLDIGNDTSEKNENRFKEINNLFERHKWKQLLVLKLNNLLLSIVPRGIFFLTSLVELHLVNCALNWIPEDVQYLENLQVLDVSHNIICSLPQHLTSLENLSIVKAPCNAIDFVCEFPNGLEILDLYDNKLESFRFDLSQFGHIDLEKNMFETSNLQDSEIYKEKVKIFREKFKFDRCYGAPSLKFTKMYSSNRSSSLEDLSDGSDESYNSDGYEEIAQNFCVNSSLYCDDECWDEEKPVKKQEQKNPDVTPSDDEWDGQEDIMNSQKKKTNLPSPCFDVDEDWIFADVEN